jgi:hypothetical protein
MSRPETRRREVHLHQNLTLLEVEGPAQMEELMALPEMRASIVRALSPTRAVLDDGRVPGLLAALERHGYLPRLDSEDAD